MVWMVKECGRAFDGEAVGMTRISARSQIDDHGLGRGARAVLA